MSAGNIRGTKVFTTRGDSCHDSLLAPDPANEQEAQRDYRLFLAGLAGAIAIPVAAQETYIVDPVHSQPQYEARHILMGSQHGNFGR